MTGTVGEEWFVSCATLRDAHKSEGSLKAKDRLNGEMKPKSNDARHLLFLGPSSEIVGRALTGSIQKTCLCEEVVTSKIGFEAVVAVASEILGFKDASSWNVGRGASQESIVVHTERIRLGIGAVSSRSSCSALRLFVLRTGIETVIDRSTSPSE